MTTQPFVKPECRWDVVIVGSGPAGTALAMSLAQKAWRVLIVEKNSSPTTSSAESFSSSSSSQLKFGESLPPTTVGLVEQLMGDSNPGSSSKSLSTERLTEFGMVKSLGNISCWQSAHADVSDFFFSAKGYGLSINRAVFDQALLSRAKASGTSLHYSTQFTGCSRYTDGPDSWTVDLQTEAGLESHSAKFLVDASGRSAVVAKALGITRERQGQLFAYAQRFVAEHNEDKDGFTRLQACAEGWWYSNRIPSALGKEACSERIVVFHTDRDLPWAKTVASREGFAKLLRKYQQLSALLEEKGYAPVGKIRGANAATERLAQFSGDGWLALGDAAQAYDPLSSQGIGKALDSGILAGQVVDTALRASALSGDHCQDQSPLFERYAKEQARLWAQYLQQSKHYYHSQPRWSDQPFWQRRGQNASGATANFLREA